MINRKTLWFTFFIVCSLVLVSGLSGVLAVETSSKSDSAAPAAPELLPSADVQVNWSGGDVYPNTTQSETSIQVNPNTGTICVAYNDTSTGTGHSRSTDGGATFVDGGSFPDAFASADPSLAWRAADGFFYFAALNALAGVGIWRSTDDCETFTYLSDVDIGDREMMVIDNNPGSPYYGRFYITGGGEHAFLLRRWRRLVGQGYRKPKWMGSMASGRPGHW